MDHDDDRDSSEAADETGATETSPTTVRHDWRQADNPSDALVETVAAATDRAPTDLPPLYGTIDPDALDVLLNGDRSSTASVSFRYADTAVCVTGNGSIEIKVDGSPAKGDGD